MPPEQRRDQRRAAVAAGGQVGARAGVEHQLRELAVVRRSRPGAASSSRSRCRGWGRRRARAAATTIARSPAIPSRSLPFVPRWRDEIGEPVEQLDEALAIVRPRPPGRRARTASAAPRRRASPRRGGAARASSRSRARAARSRRASAIADAVHRRDPVGAALVVVEVGAERLLERQPLDVRLELRPALEPQFARELELHLGQLHVLPRRAALAHAVLGLLAQLLEIELKRHRGSLPSRRASAWSGWRGSSFTSPRTRGWARPFPADWMRPSPRRVQS